jgi:hypothetical protein
MPAGMTADDLDKVYFILSQTHAVADEEDIEVGLVACCSFKEAMKAFVYLTKRDKYPVLVIL